VIWKIGLDHIFIWLGPPLPRPSTARSSCPHLHGNSSWLGTNIQPKLQVFKLTSLSLFPSWLMELLHMPKKLNCLSDWALNGLIDRVLSHWFPTGQSSHTCADRKSREDHALKEAWEGQGPTEWRCHLTWWVVLVSWNVFSVHYWWEVIYVTICHVVTIAYIAFNHTIKSTPLSVYIFCIVKLNRWKKTHKDLAAKILVRTQRGIVHIARWQSDIS
jgi:hypothetical protein